MFIDLCTVVYGESAFKQLGGVPGPLRTSGTVKKTIFYLTLTFSIFVLVTNHPTLADEFSSLHDLSYYN